MSNTLTDRSRIIAYQTCPRKRFLEYHSRNTGVRNSKVNIYTSTGSMVHTGVEHILLGKDIEESIDISLEEHEKEVKDKLYALDENEDQQFVYNEQRALGESLIRVYNKVQYPRILQEYEVLEVEKEILYPLTDNITLMSKPDAIFRSKESGSLVVYSLKTASKWDDTSQKQFKYDIQGISELVATEYLLGEEVESIKMDFLIKGSRQVLKDSNSGGNKKIQNSFLIHPYMFDTGLSQEFNLKYTKSKGWNRVNIWEVMSIREWVDYLFSNRYDDLVGTGEDNSKVIVSPAPYYRSLEDIENWIQQARYQEETINRSLETLQMECKELVGPREGVNPSFYRLSINRLFPQNRQNCFNYGGFCSYVDICWNGLRTDSSEYEARVPHHETELVQISKGE